MRFVPGATQTSRILVRRTNMGNNADAFRRTPRGVKRKSVAWADRAKPGTRVMRLGALVLALAVFAMPFAAKAQAPPTVPRAGYLSIGSASDPRRAALLVAFRQGLRDQGYMEGKNIIVEVRFAEGNYGRLRDLATELVRLKVDVIVAYGTPSAQAARNATSSIPIVMSAVVDPVRTGLVASLGRPAGNVTGLSLMSPELVGKQMQLLKELLPK